MAKVPAKKTAPVAKAAPKKTAAKPKATSSTEPGIEAACMAAVDKLRALNLDPQLQSEIDWCLASYRSDGNPVGLYEMIGRSIQVFKPELTRKTKGITAKFVSDLEKALNAR